MSKIIHTNHPNSRAARTGTPPKALFVLRNKCNSKVLTDDVFDNKRTAKDARDQYNYDKFGATTEAGVKDKRKDGTVPDGWAVVSYGPDHLLYSGGHSYA